MSWNKLFFSFIAIALLNGCSDTSSIPSVQPGARLFQLTNTSETGFSFTNKLTETRLINAMSFEGLFYGSGVGILDINNDGLQDIYMAGNQSADKLFLNKGNFTFEDITESAQIIDRGKWSQGISIGDLNGDGYDDIYVCKGLYDENNKRGNELYINQKDNTFKEMAEAYNLNDRGYSIMANIFDYDLDGDMDIYVANQPPNSAYMKQQTKGQRNLQYTDRLYANEGNKFIDVTGPSGLVNFNFSLSATVADFNKDGYPDIYVASDYEEPDLFYVNQGNGTFVNKANEYLRHMSNFAMGADIADINHDGWLDIFTADMAAEDNFRNKTNMGGMNPEKFWQLANSGYHYQYMFNAMQLNNGNGTYSEIAQMAGISNSDWSWAPLFIDADLDGHQDLFITNGQVKETRNKDYEMKRDSLVADFTAKGIDGYDILYAVSKGTPQVKISNYFYKNNGDLTFSKKAKEWGVDQLGWSQGAGYADFDNDGDLDLVTNNPDMPSFLYRNTAVEQQLGNYINIKLKGKDSNKNGQQAKVKATVNGVDHYNEMTAFRGYMSTCQPIIQFGLGENNQVDQILVEWTNGETSNIGPIKANQTITINQSEANGTKRNTSKTQALLVHSTSQIKHAENDFDDYLREILIPHKMSTLGPDVSVADVNGDGLDDLYLGGASGQPGQLLVQNSRGDFEKKSESVLTQDGKYEDVSATFFDADGDNDLDLYVVSGGNEAPKENTIYQDRLYINNGNGNFSKGRLPNIRSSGSIATPFDFDSDGDLDLFVGGRQVPGFYGFSANSILLENDNGKFKDATEHRGSVFKQMGMVTDAAWSVLDNGDTPTLIVVGEWMPVQFFKFVNGVFEKRGKIENTSGWWNDVQVNDLNNDGNLDLVLGNLGKNLKFKATPNKPFKVYLDDFDENGTHDVYLGYYDAEGNLFPVRGRQCSSQQMPFVKEKFESYGSFGNATIDEVLEGRMDGTVVKQAEMFESAVAINLGNGKFEMKALPNEAQISPIQSSIVMDIDKDGNNDIISVGNYYNREVETTRSDAGIGSILLGNGAGDFKPVHPSISGLMSYKDARKIVELKTAKGSKLLVANNNGPMDEYELTGAELE